MTTPSVILIQTNTYYLCGFIVIGVVFSSNTEEVYLLCVRQGPSRHPVLGPQDDNETGWFKQEFEDESLPLQEYGPSFYLLVSPYHREPFRDLQRSSTNTVEVNVGKPV